MARGMCLLAILAITFLLGSIPSGLLIGKFFYHTDIREQGSGNIGTTNAIRAMGPKAGLAVFAADFLKGLLSGILAIVLFDAMKQDIGLFSLGTCKAAAFLGCVYGHIFSPWLKFKGGKGIATSVGCLFITFGPLGAIIELAIFAVGVLVTRYVSVGSIAAAIACPFLAMFFFGSADPIAVMFCAIVGPTVVWAHRQNISRLQAGTENRLDFGKKG